MGFETSPCNSRFLPLKIIKQSLWDLKPFVNCKVGRIIVYNKAVPMGFETEDVPSRHV